MSCYLHFQIWTLASRIQREKHRRELGLPVYSALLTVNNTFSLMGLHKAALPRVGILFFHIHLAPKEWSTDLKVRLKQNKTNCKKKTKLCALSVQMYKSHLEHPDSWWHSPQTGSVSERFLADKQPLCFQRFCHRLGLVQTTIQICNQEQ